MTVSKSRKSQSTSKEGQERYSCDTCDADITHFIRIKCAAPGCEEIDLCPTCFCEGREVRGHKAWHDYRVVDQPTYPIYAEDWGADEELMLLEGILSSGLGDWQGVSDKLFGLRTKSAIEAHYRAVYLSSPTWPHAQKRTFPFYDRAAFLSAKRRRITLMSDAPPPPPPPRPPTSGPANHEVTGYMPGRLEFEHELVHEAEEAIADLHFGVVLQYGGDEQPEGEQEEPDADAEDAEGDGDGEDEDGPQEDQDPPDPPARIEEPEEVEVKLSLIKGYYDKLDKRIRAKQVVFQRGLLDYKKLQMAERKRPKEEREMYQRQKPFARVQTAEDFEVFVDGLLYETALKKRIMDLQQMRRDGLLSTLDTERYEKDKAVHANHRAHPERAYSLTKSVRNSLAPGERDSLPPMMPREPSAVPAAPGVRVRKPPPPLNLANAHSIHLLTPAEQVFCSTLRILPKPFLGMKEALVREFARRSGKMTRREAREVLKIDVNKVGRIWDFLRDCGLLQLANDELPQLPVSAAKTPARSPSKPAASLAAKAGPSATPPPGKLPGTNTPANPPALKYPSPSSSVGSALARPPSALGTKPFAPSPLKNASHPHPNLPTPGSSSNSTSNSNGSPPKATASLLPGPGAGARPASVVGSSSTSASGSGSGSGKKPAAGLGLGPPLSRTPSKNGSGAGGSRGMGVNGSGSGNGNGEA